jgi:hypothetical protein
MFPVGEGVAIGALYANLCSFALDYCARQKVNGTHLTYGYLEQLPIRGWLWNRASWDSAMPRPDWYLVRVLELVYTAWDLEPFASECGWAGPPFRWDEERRFLLRCELDAAFFHLYLPATADGQWKPARIADGAARDETAGELTELKRCFPTPRDAVAYIMDTFPIVRRKDEGRFDGDYRTKRVILEIYDAMQDSIRTGQPYQTCLDPPPADPRVAHESERPLPRRLLSGLVQSGRIDALDESQVLRRVHPSRNERYATCLPRLDLEIAAGAIGDDQRPEFEEWVQVNASHTLRKGMFVARVIGRSMEPLIPDGAYCLFQFKAPQLRSDMVGLFQLHGAEDPESAPPPPNATLIVRHKHRDEMPCAPCDAGVG